MSSELWVGNAVAGVAKKELKKFGCRWEKWGGSWVWAKERLLFYFNLRDELKWGFRGRERR